MSANRLTVVTLARALGISRQAVYKLVRAGMPLDSIEAAQAWRKANLDPARTVENPARRRWRGVEENAAAVLSAWPSAAPQATLDEIRATAPAIVSAWRARPGSMPEGGDRLRDLLLTLSEKQFGDVELPEDFIERCLLGLGPSSVHP